MDILMITHFCVLPCEKGNSRFDYLAKSLSLQGHDVENITSLFSHDKKMKRSMNEVNRALESLPYKITLINEPGYPKNVCLKRLSSHKVFAKNLKKYLKERKTPDLVYCSIPSLDAAVVAADYCKKNNVRFIVDVQDLWPEAFKMALNIPVLSDIVFLPMKHRANKAYGQADGIIAVSQTYAERAMCVNKKCDDAQVVYLGTDKDYFDACVGGDLPMTDSESLIQLVDKLKNNDDRIRLAYVGTLGNSYDLPTVFSAMKNLDKDVLEKIEFVVMGDGPRRVEFEALSDGLPVIFTGNLPYSEMVWILARCDIAVNPIRKGAAQSIINKHMDYAMAGLPVINTQECIEYRELVDKYRCGINCKCENVDEVATAIYELCNNLDTRVELGKNSRRMGEELFDRKTTYKQIVDEIGDKNREIK